MKDSAQATVSKTQCQPLTLIVRTDWLATLKCIDAAQHLPPDVNVDTLAFHNHGGLVFICR